MILLKLGLLSCLFYGALTVLLEAGLLAATHPFGGIFYSLGSGKHLFWNAGLRLGTGFGALWIISFSLAWYIVYQKLKLVLGSIHP